jgi:hypothetical protein
MDNIINSLVSQAVSNPSITTASTSQNPTVKLFQDTLGRTPTPQEIERFGEDIKAGQLSNFLGYARNEAVETMPKTGAVGNIANQILAQGTTDKWVGQGYGTPEKNAYDMAVMLAGQGISDINQFGQRNTADGEKEYFNKATGEAIKPFYDRAGGNIWGGTFAGKDSTAYGVDFDASGNPLFYSQSGGDSADVPSWVVPALAIGGAIYGLGGLETFLGNAPAVGASALDAGLGVYGTGAAGTAGSIVGGTSALNSLGALGGETAVAGMGTGTGLTTAKLAGLGGATGVPSLGGALGTGLTSVGAGGLGGATGAAGLGGLGTGVGAGGMAATNSLLGNAALGSTLAGTSTLPLGTTLGALGGGGGSLLGAGAGAGSALGTSLGTGLGLSALGSVLGSAANQSGISNARDLINQYGTKAQDVLTSAYGDQKGVYTGNRADLLGNFATAKSDLANTLASQRGIYDATNTNLADTYGKTQGNLYDIYNQQVGIQQPYQAVGQAGSEGLIGNQDYFNRQFTNADLNSNLAPNYAFQLQQGQMANQRAANMGGGSLGGNALRGLQDYTQNYAGNAYQNAFTNFQNQRQNIYNTLSGMANIGTTSGGQLASLGNTLGGNLGSLSSAYGGNVVSNAGQMQNAYNQYGSNLTGLNNALGGNLTSGANAMLNAGSLYGSNQANLATGIGSALAGNASASGANTATALSNLGNTALLGSMLRAT